MKEITKLKLSGWYDFSKLPQENRYIKINALNCGSDRKAINTAKKICPNETFEIKEE